MKISELIEKLGELKKRNGDINVKCWGGSDCDDIEDVDPHMMHVEGVPPWEEDEDVIMM